MMIKIVEAHYRGDFEFELCFSDGMVGVFDGHELLKQDGSLLEALRSEDFFRRAFIDAGALCWPNGLELAPARLRERLAKVA